MSAASPSPNSNLILLAVLGIGAYFYMRQAQARAASSIPAAGASNQTNGGPNGSPWSNLVGALVNGFTQSNVGTPAAAGTGSRGTTETAARPYVPWEDNLDLTAINATPTSSGSVDQWLQDNGGDQGAFF